jgi:hypothetical protein
LSPGLSPSSWLLGTYVAKVDCSLIGGSGWPELSLGAFGTEQVRAGRGVLVIRVGAQERSPALQIPFSDLAALRALLPLITAPQCHRSPRQKARSGGATSEKSYHEHNERHDQQQPQELADEDASTNRGC